MQVHSSIAILAPAVGRPELARDPRFNGTQRPSREDNAALVDIIDAIIATFEYDDLKARFDAAGVRSEPVQTPADLLVDPQVLATGRLIEIAGEDGPQWQVANPWSVVEAAGATAQKVNGPPRVGQHTAEILNELGYSSEDLARMRANGTILPAADH